MRRRALMCLVAALAAAPVHADDWTRLETRSSVAPVQIDYSQLEGNRVYLDDNLGVAMLRIAAKDAASIHFEHTMNAPYVYGTYDPANAAGSITVMKMVRLPNGDVVVGQRRFSPDDGSRFANYYGMNPFEEFRGGSSGSFVHLTPTAFNTALGIVMQHYGAHNGYIAALNTRTQVWKTTRGNFLKKTVTTHMAAYTKPVWTMVAPTGVATGTLMGYQLPNGKTVVAGMTYIPEGTGTNMPNYEYMSFYHQESNSYWTGIATLLFTGVVGNAIGGPAFATMLSTVEFTYNTLAAGGTWYLNEGVNGFFISGKSDINPGANTSQWDYHGATYGVVQTDQFSQGGALGDGFRTNRVAADQAMSGPTVHRDLDNPQDLSVNLGVTLQ